MNFSKHARRNRRERGQALVEFGACAFLLVMLLLGVVEFGRMVLAYTTICSAARIGTRFAITHGSDNVATTAQIQSVVNNYLSAAAIDTSSATVTVTYPGYASLGCASGGKNPGCPVAVSISYAYQTMVTYYPINVTLTTESEGVVTF